MTVQVKYRDEVIEPKTLVRSQPHPHLKDSLPTLKSGPPQWNRTSFKGYDSQGSQSPQPHLKDGLAYRQNRPTGEGLNPKAVSEPGS